MSTQEMKTEDAQTDERTDALQERLMSVEEEVAHLSKTVDELSDIIARQETMLDVFTRRIEMLMQREAGRESDGSGSIALADQRPPHW